MRASVIFAAFFAAFAVAAPVDNNAADIEAPSVRSIEIEPVDLETRQARSLRVQLSNDATDTAVQRNIPANGQRISIRANFAGLGSGIPANRALIVGSGSGACTIFSDANATKRVAVIRAGAADAKFGRTNLQNGVIVCQ